MKPRHRYFALPLDDGLIVARDNGHRLFVMNGSARFMWERYAEGVEDTEIPQLTATHYGIDFEQARHDFYKTFRYWQDEGLLEPSGYRHDHAIGAVPFSLRYQDARIEEALAPTFAHLKTTAPRSGPPAKEFDVGMEADQFVLHTDGSETIRSADPDEILEKLAYAVVMCAYENVEWLAAFHAAAVGNRTACVLMPGASGIGKSTLTASLLSSRRCYYLTDDIALLDRADLRVVPVPGALVLKSGSWELLEPRLPNLSAQPIRRRAGKEVRYWPPPTEWIATAPLPVKAVVYAQYEIGRKAELAPLSTLEGLSRAIAAPCTVATPITLATVEQVAGWARGIPFFTLAYGSLADATRIVEELLGP